MKRSSLAIPVPFRFSARRMFHRAKAQGFRPITGCRTQERIIALTFDDGPHQEYTPRILEVLERLQVVATFFVIGEHVSRHPALVRRIAGSGHTLGNHTGSHRRLVGQTVRTVADELRACEQAIASHSQVRTNLMRPPFGEYDVKAFLTIRSMGYQVINWASAGEDWRGDAAGRVAQRVIDDAQPGGIVLLHDGCGTFHPVAGGRGVTEDRMPTVEALPIIVEELRAKGFRFVSIPQLLGAGPALRKAWLA